MALNVVEIWNMLLFINTLRLFKQQLMELKYQENYIFTFVSSLQKEFLKLK